MKRLAFPAFTGPRRAIAASLPPHVALAPGRALRMLAWWLLLCLPLHGMGIATARIAARMHVHVQPAEGEPAIAVTVEELAMAAAAEAYARASGFGPVPAAPADAGTAHPHDDAAHDHHAAHAAAADHEHADDETGVVYLDAEPAAIHADLGTTPHRAVADLETLTRGPGPPPTFGHGSPSVQAAHCDFESQCHAPLERPPR